MKKLSLIALLAVIVLAFSSCGNKDDDYKLTTQQNFTQCFAKVTDTHVNHEEFTINSPVTIFLEVEYHSQTCNITISGLKKPDGTSYPSITIEELKWKANEQNWGICDEPNPKVTTTAAASELPSITGFKFSWNNRDILGATLHADGVSVCNFSFMIDQRYSVTGSRSELIISGETTSTSESVEPYKSSYPIYTILLKFDTMTADLRITNASFAQEMPLMQMDFLGIPFKFVDYTGKYVLETEALTPSISGTPYPSFPITELKGEIDPSKGGTITFNCGVRGALYNVSANLDILAIPTTADK